MFGYHQIQSWPTPELFTKSSTGVRVVTDIALGNVNLAFVDQLDPVPQAIAENSVVSIGLAYCDTTGALHRNVQELVPTRLLVASVKQLTPVSKSIADIVPTGVNCLSVNQLIETDRTVNSDETVIAIGLVSCVVT